MKTNVQVKRTDVKHEPGKLTFLLLLGIAVGILGSKHGWFAPVHELSHAVMVWVFGGTVHRIHWDLIEWSGVPFGSARFRAVIAAGAAGEHLVALVAMIWGLMRQKPLLSAIGAGYLAHGMGHAMTLHEWQYLQPGWFLFWELASLVVYILLLAVAYTYLMWIGYAVAQKVRGAVQSRVRAA